MLDGWLACRHGLAVFGGVDVVREIQELYYGICGRDGTMMVYVDTTLGYQVLEFNEHPMGPAYYLAGPEIRNEVFPNYLAAEL